MGVFLLIAAIAVAVCTVVVLAVAQRTFKRDAQLTIKEQKARKKSK